MSKSIKLLQHEKKLLEEQKLENITHEKASSIWLHALSHTPLEGENRCV